nr:MAG TPA: hypothetical protein [Caudoviricetes sp.]
MLYTHLHSSSLQQLKTVSTVLRHGARSFFIMACRHSAFAHIGYCRVSRQSKRARFLDQQ